MDTDELTDFIPMWAQYALATGFILAGSLLLWVVV